MPVISQELSRFSHLVKEEFWPHKGYCRDNVTVNETAAKTYAVGTVLGKVTATGKYKVCVQTASDGSQTPAAVVIGDYSVAATTDTKVLTLVKGPVEVSKAALVLDATFDNETKRNAAYAALAALGFIVSDAV